MISHAARSLAGAAALSGECAVPKSLVFALVGPRALLPAEMDKDGRIGSVQTCVPSFV